MYILNSKGNIIIYNYTQYYILQLIEFFKKNTSIILYRFRLDLYKTELITFQVYRKRFRDTVFPSSQ